MGQRCHCCPYLADASIKVAPKRKQKGICPLVERVLVASPFVGDWLAGDVLEGTGNLFNGLPAEFKVESCIISPGVLHHRKLVLGIGYLGGKLPILVKLFGQVRPTLIKEKWIQRFVFGVQTLNGEILAGMLPKGIEAVTDGEKFLFECRLLLCCNVCHNSNKTIPYSPNLVNS